MAKIVVNMRDNNRRNITIISDEITMGKAIVSVKEAVKAFSSESNKVESETYKITKIK